MEYDGQCFVITNDSHYFFRHLESLASPPPLDVFPAIIRSSMTGGSWIRSIRGHVQVITIPWGWPSKSQQIIVSQPRDMDGADTKMGEPQSTFAIFCSTHAVLYSIPSMTTWIWLIKFRIQAQLWVWSHPRLHGPPVIYNSVATIFKSSKFKSQTLWK